MYLNIRRGCGASCQERLCCILLSGEVVVNFNVSRGCGVSLSGEIMVYINIRRSCGVS